MKMILINYVLNPDPEKSLIFFQNKKHRQRQFLKMQSIYRDELINADGSIAIRIVKDEFCQTLISQLDAPLVSTSANISGDPSSQNFTEINDEIKNGVDYIVQHRQNETEIISAIFYNTIKS